MMNVQSATAVSNYYQSGAASSVVTVAAAFSAIKVNPRAKFDIVDTAANIEKNLDELKKVVNNVKSLALDGSSSEVVVHLTGKQMTTQGVLTLLNKKSASGQDSGIRLNVTEVLAKDVATLNSANPAYAKVSQFSVKDSTGNIALKLSSLKDSGNKLQEIWLTNTSAPVKVTYAQYADNTDVLAKLKGTVGVDVSGATAAQAVALDVNLVSAVSILDHSQAIADHLDALQSVLGVKVKALATSDNAPAPLKLSASQLQTDKVVIGKLYKGFQLALFNVDSTSAMELKSIKKVVSMDIVDTADNLSKNLVLLDRLGSQIHSVRVLDADPTAHPLKMSSFDFLTHGHVLSKVINTTYTGDEPDAVQSTTPTADNNIYQINIVDASAVDAQAIKDNDHVLHITVNDSSAAIAINLDDLNNNAKITGISQSGTASTLDITAAQWANDQNALSLLGGDNFMLNVREVAAQDALGLLDNARVASISVSDEGTNLLSHLDDLAQLGKKLTSITQKDAGQLLQLTASNWTSHIGVLSKIVGGYGVDLTEVSAAQALSLAPDLRVRSLNVSDSSAAISANLDALMGLGSKLATISQSDTSAIQVTGKQFGAYAAQALAKLGEDYTLAVNNARANQVQDMAANSHVTAIQVADTASNIGSNLSALQSAVAAHADLPIQVDMVGKSSAFNLSKTQLDGYADALGKINGNYTVNVSDVALTEALDVAANTHVVSMDVKAAAGDLTAVDGNGNLSHLRELTSLGTKLNRIVQTDAGTPLTLSVPQWSSNLGVLSKIQGYSVALTGASVASGLSLLSKAHVKSISINDTANQISGNFDRLMALGKSLDGLTQTGAGHLKLSMTQWSAAAAAPTLAKVTGEYLVDLSGASATQAQSLSGNDHIGQIAVMDTSANLSGAKLGALIDNTKIASLQLSDLAKAVSLSLQQFQDNAALLAKFQGSYGFAVDHVNIADMGAVFANAHVNSAEVQGSASDIKGALNTLLLNSGRVKSLSLTGGDASMSLDYGDFLKYKPVLGRVNQTISSAAPLSLTLNKLTVNAALTEANNRQFLINAMNVEDSASQVAANLNALNNLGAKLTALKTKEPLPVLSLTADQYVAGQSTLAKLNPTGDYKLSVSAVSMSLAGNMLNNGHVQTMSVLDSAGTVTSQLNLLQDAKISTVTLTDDAPVLNVTGAQYTSSLSSLSKIRTPFSLNVSAATPDQAVALQADAKVSQFALVTDSNVGLDVASFIGVDFPALLNMDKLDHIDFSQSNPRIALTVAQLADVQDNQAKLRGDYAFDVSGVSMSDLNDFLTTQPSHMGSVKVSDTSQAIAAGWDDLSGLTADGLASLTVTTPQTPVAITMAQYKDAAVALSKLGAQPLALLDVAPDEATAAAAYAHVASVSVKGSAAEVAAQFDNLSALGSQVDDIEITGGGPLMLSQDQVDNGQATLDKIMGGHYDIQVVA